MFRYIYPIRLEPNTLVSLNDILYKTLIPLDLIWIDYAHIKEELNIDKEVFNNIYGNEYLSDIIGDPNDRVLSIYPGCFIHVADKCFDRPDEGSKHRSIVNPIMRGMDRYLSLNTYCVHVGKDIVEEIEMREDAVKLDHKLNLPHNNVTSFFELIEVITLHEGETYEDDNDQIRICTKAIDIFLMADTECYDPILKSNGLPFTGVGSDRVLNLHHGEFVTDDIMELDAAFDTQEGGERFYRFLNLSIHVKPGYTRIIPLYVPTLKRIHSYKDITIIAS